MQSTMEFKDIQDTIPSSRFYGVVGEVRHWYMNSGLTKWSPHEAWQVLRWVLRGFKENVISLGLKWSRKAAWQNCLALKAVLAFIGGLEFGWAEWRECHMQSRCEKLCGAPKGMREAQGMKSCGFGLQNGRGCFFPALLSFHCFCLPFPPSLHKWSFSLSLVSSFHFSLTLFPSMFWLSLFLSFTSSLLPSLSLMWSETISPNIAFIE